MPLDLMTQPVGLPRRIAHTVMRARQGTVLATGFMAGLAWAFVGSLLLGLGSGTDDAATAWLWLGGEVLVGVATAALLVRRASGQGGGEGR